MVPGESILKTHIPELDEALGGGIKRGGALSIIGGYGTGKTTLAMQIAFNNISRGNTCSYHTHDQNARMLVEMMKGFGWDPEPYMDNFHILDFYTILGPSEDELDTLPALSLEENLARKLDIKLLLKRSSKDMREHLGRLPDLMIVDSATPLLIQLGVRKLYLLYRMAKQLLTRNMASIVTAQLGAIDEKDLDTLNSLSEYSLYLEDQGGESFHIRIKTRLGWLGGSIPYVITGRGITPLSVEDTREQISVCVRSHQDIFRRHSSWIKAN